MPANTQKFINNSRHISMNQDRRHTNIDYFNDFPLTLTGAESVHIHEICNHLQALGCSVRLFSPATQTDLNQKYAHIPVQTPRFLKSVFYQLTIIPPLFRAWRKQRPNALYMRVTPILLIPAILAKLFNIPLYAEINGTIHDELRKANTKLGRILLWFHISDTVEMLVYRQATKVITVTDSIKSYIENRYSVTPAKISVLENGVNAETLRPFPPTPNKSKQFTIGYVGGLMWWQGLEYVVQAMQKVVSKQPNLVLVIVGEGPERNKLEQLAADLGISASVKLPGSITHDMVAETINNFDICIAYYVKARAGLNSPFKVYEYLACGKPVIVSNISGIGNVFSGVACVIEPENPRALAQAILSLAANFKKRSVMSKRARDYIVNGHTWLNVASTLIDIIEESNNRQ
jgi:starch synthase